MCYSALIERDLERLEKEYGAEAAKDIFEKYGFLHTIDEKKFPPLADRIYPGHYAPVIHESGGRRVVELMRYSAYGPGPEAVFKNYTTYNARKDNLTSSFWSEAFMHHHGFVVLKGFFEWVSVSDLLKAGQVKMEDVEEAFQLQAVTRKEKVLASGKKYRPTLTEQKPLTERKTIISFVPREGEDLIAPVIFSRGQSATEGSSHGFAIVTGEPPEDISSAGHDRCPIFLQPEAIREWMRVQGRTVREVVSILDRPMKHHFAHTLAASLSPFAA